MPSSRSSRRGPSDSAGHKSGIALPSPDVRRARRSVGAVFTVHGAVTGCFATRIPWIQEHLGLSTGQLGLALAFPAIGAAVAMPMAGRIVHRWGARAALRTLLVLWCLALALPALAPHPIALCAALAIFGATAGMADVVMNAQGVEVEERYGRSIMSGLHGLWSVGALIGSAVGVAVVHLGVDARIHLPAASLALAVLARFAVRGVLDVRAKPGETAPPRFTLPPRSALLIGAIGMCAVFGEGAGMDWSGVYLREVTGSSETVAAAGYTGFACTMAIARLLGDSVVRRMGVVRTVRAGGLLATAGGALVVVAPVPAVGVAGFALLGVGIAVVVPLTFAAAGRSGAQPARAIAGVATITYTTGLVAPAVIGMLGEVSSLRLSFALVTGAAVVLFLCAGVLAPGRQGPAGGTSVTGGAGAAGGAGVVPASGPDPGGAAASVGGGHAAHGLGEHGR
ncbi:MFS transporter [Streptomyces sp. ST2-7A]|uniref:MFS transporter n=1 Tax=Streptomyces sp. ST2-7A TaxID=2907214 RepID=UPI001F20C907|nr:MFS transporter [Streptomyces sp. ST2-7A]MCE7079673.1 MFS transporter [Streptomyces sp. ST2-7A]